MTDVLPSCPLGAEFVPSPWTFGPDPSGAVPGMWDRDGVPWHRAVPARSRWLRRHHHETQTVAWMDMHHEWVERCACAATRFDLTGPWIEERRP